jgi:hypothetical protein
MDYLDPKKKKAHRQRLLIGYMLIAVIIGIVTMVLVYVANGYYIDRSTGEVIQNGLVFIDSKPGGAKIVINGEQQRGTTDARIVIPAGEYTIELQREGYRTWSRSLILEGGSLRRLTYARLMPTELDTTTAVSFRADPIAASQSIDRRWILVSHAIEPLRLTLLDTTTANIIPTEIIVPDSVVSDPVGGVLRAEEWSADNRYILMTYTTAAKYEYLLIDRENPTNSQNLSNILAIPGAEISLRDRAHDQYFVYDTNTKSVVRATLTGGIEEVPFLVGTLAYRAFGNDWAVYITSSKQEGLVEARFKRGDNDILLKEITGSDTYFLELAKLGNAPIMGIGTQADERITVYNDPELYLRENPSSRIPVATTVLRSKNPLGVSISSDSSIILAYGSENFATHEFEADRSYTFKNTAPLDSGQQVRWLDGQHFVYSSDGIQIVTDFDGSNSYSLIEAIAEIGAFYSENFERMYTFRPSNLAEGANVGQLASMQATELLAIQDR